MNWSSIPAIDSLQRDLDQRFPKRVKPDWILGDADHSARVSDHNPAYDGDVHAIDIRLGGDLNVKDVLEACIGDRRVKYVIHNRIIYSRTYGWQALRYTGENPHTTHIHVSFRYEPRFENDTSAWFDTKVRTKPVPIDLSVVRKQFFIALGLDHDPLRSTVHVMRLQRALNVKIDADLEVDGYVGRATLNAWGRWERRREVPGEGRPRVPDKKSLAALVAARWRMVA